MMASPADLEDFAIGFSFTEGIISDPSELLGLEVIQQPGGIEVRSWLPPGRGARQAARRRLLAGPTGCGLCGVESLQAALAAPAPVTGRLVCRADQLLAAMEAMSDAQRLGRSTRATHAAAFWQAGALVAVREDVGRHNALDKLIGGLLRMGAAPDGIVLLTSRVSVEMVQKAAMFGAPILCAVSAPTALAVRMAHEAGLTLVAVCRADGFEVFTHPQRIDTP
jgi:FdhD protein